MEVLLMKRKYDYIIVGAGSAGAILGDRLSADGKHSVLDFAAGNPLYDWIYKSDPEPYMHGRRIKHARGKVLGGSSSINGMIYQRGNPMDYERWGKDKGMETWDFAHVLPYFKRLENALDSPN